MDELPKCYIFLSSMSRMKEAVVLVCGRQCHFYFLGIKVILFRGLMLFHALIILEYRVGC